MSDSYRCVFEAGFDYSADSIREPAVWEQMLSKSPVQLVPQVWEVIVCQLIMSMWLLTGAHPAVYTSHEYRYRRQSYSYSEKMTSACPTNKELNITELWKQSRCLSGELLLWPLSFVVSVHMNCSFSDWCSDLKFIFYFFMCSLLIYPGNNHSLSNVDAESDSFMNSALWIIQHLSVSDRAWMKRG